MRPLDQMLCFDLYAASRALTGLYRPMLEPLGLTYPQYLVLLTLPESDSGSEPLSVSQLAARLELDHGTLSPLLRRMEAAGQLTRTRSSVDERVVEVRLTDHGARLRREFDDVQCEVERALGLGEDQLLDLQRVLKQMTSRVREHAVAGDVSDR